MNALAFAYNISAPLISNEPVDRLPEIARNKLRRLVQIADDSYATMTPLSDQMHELRAELHGHAARMRALEMQGVANDHTAMEDARIKHDRAKAALERAQALHQERSALWRPRKALATRLEEFVAKLSGDVTEIESPQPVLKRGETATAAVERLRSDVVRLRNEIAFVELSTLPKDVAKAMWKTRIERARERGRPSVAMLVSREHGVGLPVPSTRVICRAADGAVASSAEVADVASVLAYAVGDQWLAAIEADIDSADDSGGLTDAQRHERLAELKQELLAVERAEEALVEQSGIERRADASPAAVLGIAA